ncbi:hypothetical protein TWF281_008275 [Arthrobotrys megalospora]
MLRDIGDSSCSEDVLWRVKAAFINGPAAWLLYQFCSEIEMLCTGTVRAVLEPSTTAAAAYTLASPERKWVNIKRREYGSILRYQALLVLPPAPNLHDIFVLLPACQWRGKHI